MSAAHTANPEQASIMYIEHYLDLAENLPGGIARTMSRIHEIDIQRTKIANILNTSLQEYLRNTISESEKQKLLNKFLTMLVKMQNLSDNKICLAQNIYDQIDIKSRLLESQSRACSSLNSNQQQQQHTSNSAGGSNSTSSSANVNNSYSKANGNANSSSAREATTSNGTSNNTPAAAKDTSQSTQNSSSSKASSAESNISAERNATAATASKENNIDSSAKESTPTHSNGNGNGKRASRRSQGNKKDSKEDGSNGGSGDDRSSTPVATEHRESKGTGKRGGASGGKRGLKGAKKNAEGAGGKRRKNSYNYNNNDSPTNMYGSQIDPDEPTYCLCEQVSYGEMICCDNSNCKIEWFHFACVGLTSIPKGRWFCPDCRGDRSNIQKKP